MQCPAARSPAHRACTGHSAYINASIIIQLLTVAIPALERLAKDGGEDGKKKIERITRYTTVGLGLLMGWAYYMMLRNYSSQISIITSEGLLPALVIILASPPAPLWSCGWASRSRNSVSAMVSP